MWSPLSICSTYGIANRERWMVPVVTGDVHPSALCVSIKLLVTNSELSMIPRKVTAHCKIYEKEKSEMARLGTAMDFTNT